MGARKLGCALLLALLPLLAAAAGPAHAAGSGSSSPLQSYLQSKLIQGFVGATDKLRTLPPLLGGLVEGVRQRRLRRGDVQGAARLVALQQWTSYTGLHRGVPALGLDLMRHRTLVAALVAEWRELGQRALDSAPAGEAWLDMLVRQQGPVLELLAAQLRRAKKAFKGGAVARLAWELAAEAAADPAHLASDIAAELMAPSAAAGAGAGAAGAPPTASGQAPPPGAPPPPQHQQQQQQPKQTAAGAGSGSSNGAASSDGGLAGAVPEQVMALLQRALAAAREVFPDLGVPPPPAPPPRAAGGNGGSRRKRRREAGARGEL